jgi:hypothetical protein
MPGLVPGIHVFFAFNRGVDGRDKSGHGEQEISAASSGNLRLLN